MFSEISTISLLVFRFGVTDDMVEPHLEGLTIQQAIDAKRLFIIDYEILQGVYTKDGAIVSAANCCTVNLACQ